MTLRAQDVFTPGAYPKHTYVQRSDDQLEGTLRDALETPGQIASVSEPSMPTDSNYALSAFGTNVLRCGGTISRCSASR